MRTLIGRWLQWWKGGKTIDWGAGPVFVPDGWTWSMSVTPQCNTRDTHVTGQRYVFTLTKDVPEPTPIPLHNPAYAHLWQPETGADPAGGQSVEKLPTHPSEELSP